MIAELRKTPRARSVEYLCQKCDTTFCLIDNRAMCPTCGSADLQRMVIVYMEDDPDFDEMLTKDDLRAGD